MLAHSAVLLYPAHAVFWAAFGVPLVLARSVKRKQAPAPDVARAARQDTAPHSRALLWAHSLAFAVMYLGMEAAAFGTHFALLFPGQPLAGGAVIALGALLCAWAMLSFGSWRFRAALEPGHELATGGPFRFLRHPIYMSLNLLALGSALWLPAPILWVAFVLMMVGSELRARAEESLLRRNFGDAYISYCKRTARFIPGVY